MLQADFRNSLVLSKKLLQQQLSVAGELTATEAQAEVALNKLVGVICAVQGYTRNSDFDRLVG